MKIVVLDGETTNPGDISWKPLESLGELTVYPETPRELVVDRCKGAEAVILNRNILDSKTLKELTTVRYIGTLATGFNTIDVACARELGIPVCNVPDYCVKTVAQMAIALLLSLTNHVSEHNALVKNDKWRESIELSYGENPIVELAGKTLGILGFGNIGKAVAKIAEAFGMRVIAYSRSQKGENIVSMDELFKNSDVLSIHCALNDDTKGIVNREKLALMKPGAFIINTARGAIINEADLGDALNKGIIAGAALDVLTNEPPKSDNPLLTAKNCQITPHVAWASRDARGRLISIVAENLAAYVSGNLQNRVN